MVSAKTEIKKQKCYYSRNKSQWDKYVRLDEFIEKCDREAKKTVFLSSWESKKRVICDSEKCLEKATADLNILLKERKQRQETAKKLKKLRGQGLSDSEILAKWDQIN